MRVLLRLVLLALSTCTVSASPVISNGTQHKHAARSFVAGSWGLVQHGTTGVAGQQMAIVSETKAIIYDRVEHNPLTTDGHLAWAAEYDLVTDAVRALHPLSNSFCAAGAHLSNGTHINTGGNAILLSGDASGLQGVRMFTPCDNGDCDVLEFPNRVRLTSSRWYPSAVRLDDGSVIIFGGSTGNGFIDNSGTSNPSYEFFPPKNINGHNGLQIPSPFLVDALNANQFPIMFVLPDGKLFIAANQLAMIFDWRTNTEIRLPGIPNGVRVTSPFSAAAVLLPLTPANNYTPEVLICGGSTISDQVDPSTISSQTPASKQCIRMVLNDAGIAAGWEVESMPQARVMADAILLPDGRVLIVNGAQTGVAGFGDVADIIGQSDADHPASTPVVYDPSAPAGSRFSSSEMPTTEIPRVYHSVASLVPDGRIMLAGSNPNPDVSTVKYATEYRVEWISPAYLSEAGPRYLGLPATIDFGTVFTLQVFGLPAGTTHVRVALIDLGVATHAVHMDQRLVELVAELSADQKTLNVTAPPNGMIYPPGPGYLYVVTDDGLLSFGHKTIVGTGASPPVDEDAIANMLSHTTGAAPAKGEKSVPTSPIPAPP